MTERDYAKSLRRHWRLALACIALSLVAVAAYSSAITPQYRATATMFVSIRIDDPGAAYQAGMFTQQRVQSYADIVDSPAVMQAVIDALDLDTTPEELAGRVDADAPIDTVLLRVSATDASARQAGAIANAVAMAFSGQVAELERAAGNEESPVQATLVGPAGSGSRTQAGLALNLALGGVLGALIGFGAAVLRDSLDRTVEAGELEERLGLPVLARIPDGTDRRGGGVAALARPRSRSAEEFRTLRTNLQFASGESPPRSIVVTSAHQGEGKTTTLCNLAVVLAQAGHSVIAVSGDLRHPRLDEVTGARGGPGLTGVLAGRASLDEALRPWGAPGMVLHVLPSGPLPGNPSEVLASQGMRDLVERLEERVEYVLIDAPPVLPFTDAAVLGVVASGVLLVVRSGKTPYEQVRRAARALDAVGAHLFGAVMTMTPRGGDSHYARDYHYDEQSSSGATLPLVGSGSSPPGRPGKEVDGDAGGPSAARALRGR